MAINIGDAAFGSLMFFVFLAELVIAILALIFIASTLWRLHKALGIYIREHEPVKDDKTDD